MSGGEGTSSFVGAVGMRDTGGFLIEALSRLSGDGGGDGGLALVSASGSIRRVRSSKLKAGAPSSWWGAEPVYKAGLGLAPTQQKPLQASSDPKGKSIAKHFPAKMGRVCVVHSGKIEIDTRRQTWLQKYGAERNSRSDAEIIAYHLNHVLEAGGSTHDALSRVFNLVAGAFAFAAVIEGEPNLIIAGQKGAPLFIAADHSTFYFATEPTVLVGNADRVWGLEAGDRVVIRGNVVDLRDETNREVSRPLFHSSNEDRDLVIKVSPRIDIADG